MTGTVLILQSFILKPAKGMNEPNYFTPMHPSARAEVMKQYGIDLNKIFDPSSYYYWKNNRDVENKITNYRVKQLDTVYQVLLKSFYEVASKKNGFEVMVTAMDSHGSPGIKGIYRCRYAGHYAFAETVSGLHFRLRTLKIFGQLIR